MNEQEYSESGSPIYRYDPVDPKDFSPVYGDSNNIEIISKHIEDHVGEIESVFHELISDNVHIDIHWVKPCDTFPFHKLITSGMSDKPMNTPKDLDVSQYSELCVLLPKDWKIDESAFEDESNYWPLRWLKIIARFPHEYNTWIGPGHTIPNGENAEPFWSNTKLGCILLLPSISLNDDFYELKLSPDKTINFYCLYPIYKEEMNLKLKKGSDALIDLFEKENITDIINVNRKNTCAKRGLFGLW